MQITLTLHDGRTALCEPPEPGARAVECTAFQCACSREEPLLVRGVSEGAALCARCGGSVGRLTVRAETLFGDEEDRAVLIFGRARVY